MEGMEKGEPEPVGAPSKPSIRPEILSKMVGVPLRREDAATLVLPLPGVLVAGDPGHAMELSRAGLARIAFLPPEHTPSAPLVARAVPQEVRRRCAAALDLSPPAIEAARSALAGETRGVLPKARRSLEVAIATNAPSDGDVHDIFFNIRRASKPEPAFFLQCVIETLIAFRQDLAETPVTVGPSALSSIETGLLTTLALALGEGVRRSRGQFSVATTAAFEDHAARRWIRGHQIFAALSQGLIAAMERLGESGADESGTGGVVEQVVIGLDACAAALAFTGDFAEDVYEERIRPSMCPPFMPRGFSGLLSSDHLRLVRSIKEMKPVMEALRAADPEGHGAIAAAMHRVYDSHKHVCSKFVGTERSSLLMTGEPTRSSVDQLERFKAMRIRDLG